MTQPVLTPVLQEIRAVRQRGALPLVVFDLDSTLFCTGARNLRILHDFARQHAGLHPGLEAVVQRFGPADMGWNVNDALRRQGLHDAALHGTLKRFWAERFFTDEFVILDEPVRGAPAFARACHEAGALLYYLTGRHVGGMEQGTTASLLQHGFPLFCGNSILHLKPRFDMADGAFKQQALESIRSVHGEVVATFENEPGNANLFLRTFPQARHYLLLTVHSPEAEAPDPALISVPHFEA